MRLARSSKYDFMVLNFANSLLKVSQNDNGDEGVEARANNKDYSKNKRIDRRIQTITSFLDNVMQEMYNLGGADLQAWVRNNLHKRIGNTLTRLQEEAINLEYLALFILYVNFAPNERKGKALTAPMELIQHKMSYILETTAMFEDLEVGKLEEQMYESAYKVIQNIKS